MIDLEKVARVIYEAHGDERTPDWYGRQVLDDVLCGELARAATREVLVQLMGPDTGGISYMMKSLHDDISNGADPTCVTAADNAWKARLKHIMENEL